jgi:hypothetical protein
MWRATLHATKNFFSPDFVIHKYYVKLLPVIFFENFTSHANCFIYNMSYLFNWKFADLLSFTIYAQQ